MTQSIIQVSDLNICYNNFTALEQINFQCKPGEFVAIVGRSGTGKSSFLNALAGLVPFSGEVQVRGRVGYVFQSYALFPWMTVYDNIQFGLRTSMTKEQRHARILDLLQRTGLEPFSRKYPGQMSGGQIQRVALARALAPDPDILFMDEPYGALDHHTRDRMQAWLLSIWSQFGKTVLFVTHYLEEAIYLADRIVVVNGKQFATEIQVPFPRPRHEQLRFDQQFLDVKQVLLKAMDFT